MARRRIGALLLGVTACCGSGAPLQGAAYNETLAMKGAVWSSIAYGPPVRMYVCMYQDGRRRHVLIWIMMLNTHPLDRRPSTGGRGGGLHLQRHLPRAPAGVPDHRGRPRDRVVLGRRSRLKEGGLAGRLCIDTRTRTRTHAKFMHRPTTARRATRSPTPAWTTSSASSWWRSKVREGFCREIRMGLLWCGTGFQNFKGTRRASQIDVTCGTGPHNTIIVPVTCYCYSILTKGSNDTEDFITDAEGPFRYRFDCALDGVSLGKTHHGFCAYVTNSKSSRRGFCSCLLDRLTA